MTKEILDQVQDMIIAAFGRLEQHEIGVGPDGCIAIVGGKGARGDTAIEAVDHAIRFKQSGQIDPRYAVSPDFEFRPFKRYRLSEPSTTQAGAADVVPSGVATL